MSTKGKGKAEDTTSVISDNEGKKALISAITTTVIKLKKDTLIKIKESTVFSGDRAKFSIYKTSVDLAVWTDNKRDKSNRIIKTVPEQVA
jgi:hypothetical protein